MTPFSVFTNLFPPRGRNLGTGWGLGRKSWLFPRAEQVTPLKTRMEQGS